MAAIIEVVDLVKHFPASRRWTGSALPFRWQLFRPARPERAGKTTTIELLEGSSPRTAARSCSTVPRAAPITALASASSFSTRRCRIS